VYQLISRAVCCHLGGLLVCIVHCVFSFSSGVRADFCSACGSCQLAHSFAAAAVILRVVRALFLCFSCVICIIDGL